MSRIAFLGLGVMGYPMAGHLVNSGHQVSVWNRSPEKSKAWGEQHKGRRADTVADAVKDVEMVMLCVGEDKDVYAVVEPVSYTHLTLPTTPYV